MHESARFLRSLEHRNPERPRFFIDPTGYENLEIRHRGQSIRLPMAEVLAFARRWEADAWSRHESASVRRTLSTDAHPLRNVRPDDPDVARDGF